LTKQHAVVVTTLQADGIVPEDVDGRDDLHSAIVAR
jgi:hypothetical protein